MLTLFVALKRRRRLLRVLAASALLLLAGVALLLCYSHDSLDDYVDQDLRKLDDTPRSAPEKALAYLFPEQFPGPRTRLNRLLQRTLPEDFTPKAEPIEQLFWGFEPWYLWRVKVETGSRYILFQGRPLRMIPDASGAAIHVFDLNGKYERHSVISTGWRIQIMDAALRHDDSVGALTLEIRTEPSLNGAFVGRQIYAILENRVALMRIEDLDGKLIANRYAAPNHQLGPNPPMRTETEWEQLLLSLDPRHVLEALTWIGGRHCTQAELRELDQQRVGHEEGEAALLAAAVRMRPSVQKRIADLAASENQWIRSDGVVERQAVIRAESC